MGKLKELSGLMGRSETIAQDCVTEVASKFDIPKRKVMDIILEHYLYLQKPHSLQSLIQPWDDVKEKYDRLLKKPDVAYVNFLEDQSLMTNVIYQGISVLDYQSFLPENCTVKLTLYEGTDWKKALAKPKSINTDLTGPLFAGFWYSYLQQTEWEKYVTSSDHVKDLSGEKQRLFKEAEKKKLKGERRFRQCMERGNQRIFIRFSIVRTLDYAHALLVVYNVVTGVIDIYDTDIKPIGKSTFRHAMPYILSNKKVSNITSGSLPVGWI
jgi:hypothetical protein